MHNSASHSCHRCPLSHPKLTNQLLATLKIDQSEPSCLSSSESHLVSDVHHILCVRVSTPSCLFMNYLAVQRWSLTCRIVQQTQFWSCWYTAVQYFNLNDKFMWHSFPPMVKLHKMLSHPVNMTHGFHSAHSWVNTCKVVSQSFCAVPWLSTAQSWSVHPVVLRCVSVIYCLCL